MTNRREHQTIRPLLIGVGNAYRRDDAVGLIATRALRPVIGAACTIREESGEGATLMEAWSDAEVVVLLDAAKSGAQPGTIVRLDAGAGPLPAHFFHYSTHAFGVAEAIELARTLGRLPGRLVVFGVEGADFTAGEELSPPVARAVPQLVDAVLDELRVLGVLT
jgi:hydrogenase maturation protease